MNAQQEQGEARKRPLSFCVVVESSLPEEEARTIVNMLLDAGLAEAHRTLETDIDDELRQHAQDAVDMDVHAPVLLELPRLSTFPPPQPAAEGVLPSLLKPRADFDLPVYVEAYAVDDNGDGPTLAEFKVDSAFIERLTRLHTVCVENDLREARVQDGPDWGPYGIEDDLRLQNHILVVTSTGDFWYSASVKHADYAVETRAMSVETLIERVHSAIAKGDEYLQCGDWDDEDAIEAITEYRDAKAAASPTPH
ncbi:MAG: hypothetical protein ACREPQ_00595 [Rhodanobacter sp.]